MMLHGYGRDYRTLRARSPGAIDSGYLMLTALDGTVPAMREQIAQVVNVDGGGESVRMVVVPAAGPSSPATRRLGERLQEEAPKLELERIARLHAEQDDTAAALERIEALADRGPLDEAEAEEARGLVRAARASVVDCDAACDAVGSQPADVAERVLAAREHVLATAA